MIFHLIWSFFMLFLFVLNSNLGPTSHRFRDMATYNLKDSIENCGQTAADGEMVTIGYYCQSPARYPLVPSPIPYDLPFSHNKSVTDKQTDGQTDKRQFIPITQPLLKYVRLKAYSFKHACSNVPMAARTLPQNPPLTWHWALTIKDLSILLTCCSLVMRLWQCYSAEYRHDSRCRIQGRSVFFDRISAVTPNLINDHPMEDDMVATLHRGQRRVFMFGVEFFGPGLAVHRVNPETGFSEHSWPIVLGMYITFTLSVAGDQLLVTLWDEIQHYDTDGTPIRIIRPNLQRLEELQEAYLLPGGSIWSHSQISNPVIESGKLT